MLTRLLFEADGLTLKPTFVLGFILLLSQFKQYNLVTPVFAQLYAGAGYGCNLRYPKVVASSASVYRSE